jgi:hypothetical protein
MALWRTWAVVASAAMVVSGFVVGAQPAYAVPASASCSEAGVTWRVDHEKSSTVFGPAVQVTGLKRIQGGTETDGSGLTWELRYDHLPADYPPASPPPTWPGSYPTSFTSVRGTLTPSGVGRVVVEYLSPRLVSPDGACTVYLSPFFRNAAQSAWPRVAVLGDDLVHQLNDRDFNTNQSAFQGYVEALLNGGQIRTEVEGHTGARWTSDGSSAPLDRANSNLLDEFRGLAEYDLSGTVVALGLNDALYIAAGVDQAARDARLREVTDKLATEAAEISARSGCLAVVTAPENASNLSPNYAAAAKSVNDWFRFVTTVGGPYDNVELIDFGAEAGSHTFTDPQPWFGPDNVHLAGAGLLVYTAELGKAAARCATSVTLWGKQGTLDKGVLAGKTQVPSGQRYGTRAVTGWTPLPGQQPWFSAIANDGTIFSMTVGSNLNVFNTAGEGMSIPAFDPDSGSYTNIKVKTDRNKTIIRAPDGDAAGWDIGDIDSYSGGNAIVFTGSNLGWPAWQNPDTDGFYPVFGILTKAGDGTWRVAEGPDNNGDGLPDWRNSWSSRELVAATLAADPQRGQQLADLLCPQSAGEPPNCFWLNELAVLPQSQDIAIAQYSNKVAVLKVDGPDSSGRYAARIGGVYAIPEIDDPSWDDPAHKIGIGAREVQADPTSALGDERFALSADMSADRYNQDGQVVSQVINGPIIEFGYTAGTGDVTPTSAPFLSGEVDPTIEPVTGLKATTGMGAMHYDTLGNLWLPWGGLGAKVYVKTSGGRTFSRAPCLQAGKPLQDYVATLPGARAMWGTVCPADYNIRQPDLVGPVFKVMEDPATHNIVIGSWPSANTIVVEPHGSGTTMTFRVSDPAAPVAQGVTTERADPCCTPWIAAMLGPVDASGRTWFHVSQGKNPGAPDDTEHQTKVYDQWMYSVDLSRLLGREPVQLTAKPSQASIVQAELTSTFTTAQGPGQPAVTDVTSDAALSVCPFFQPCTDPVSGVNGGFALGDDNTGTTAATTADYRIAIPKTGTYQLIYRAANRRTSGAAVIRTTIDGASPINTTISNTSFQDVTGPTITLSAGTHTLRLASAPNAFGWQLDWMKFTRGSG